MRHLKRLAGFAVLGGLFISIAGCVSIDARRGGPPHTPPGLAKKGGMPPGQARKYDHPHHRDDPSVSVDVGVSVER